MSDVESIYVPPGQFVTRHGSRCNDCGDFIPKGDIAGYDDDDEIVCDTCWIPYEDR
jgi:formylmethanofuran dehydrogenase subunit E